MEFFIDRIDFFIKGINGFINQNQTASAESNLSQPQKQFSPLFNKRKNHCANKPAGSNLTLQLTEEYPSRSDQSRSMPINGSTNTKNCFNQKQTDSSPENGFSPLIAKRQKPLTAKRDGIAAKQQLRPMCIPNLRLQNRPARKVKLFETKEER